MVNNFLEGIVTGIDEKFERTQDETLQNLRKANLMPPLLDMSSCSELLDRHDGPNIFRLKPLKLDLILVDKEQTPYEHIKKIAKRASKKENIPFPLLMLSLQKEGFFTEDDREDYLNSHFIHSNIRALRRGIEPVFTFKNAVSEEVNSLTLAISQLGRESMEVIDYGVNSGIESVNGLVDKAKSNSNKIEVKVDYPETPKISAIADSKVDEEVMSEVLRTRDKIANGIRYVTNCLNMGITPDEDEIKKLAGEHADRITIEKSHRTLGEIIKDAMPNISRKKAVAYSIPIVLAGGIATTYALNGFTNEQIQDAYNDTMEVASDIGKDASMNVASIIGYLTKGSLISKSEDVDTQIEQTASITTNNPPNTYLPSGTERRWHFDPQSAVWYNLSSDDPNVRVNVVSRDVIIDQLIYKSSNVDCDNNNFYSDMQKIIRISGTEEQNRDYLSAIQNNCQDKFE